MLLEGRIGREMLGSVGPSCSLVRQLQLLHDDCGVLDTLLSLVILVNAGHGTLRDLVQTQADFSV